MTNLCVGDWAGCDDVRRDAQWTELESGIVRQSIDTGLCNRYVRLEWYTGIMKSGTDEDDSTTGALGVRFHLGIS